MVALRRRVRRGPPPSIASQRLKYNVHERQPLPAMTLVRSHFDRIKRRLIAEGQTAKSFRHGANRGQIREAFVREFLSQNTSHLTGIGTGEIIHAGTSPDEPRNQIDVIIHNNRYPKISMATGVDLFFVETVSSFIEIKSSLRKEHLTARGRSLFAELACSSSLAMSD